MSQVCPISGVQSVQGRRAAMEDTFVMLDNVKEAFPETNLSKDHYSFYGVYDGHGGSEVALVCEKILHKNIITDPEFSNHNIEEAIKNGFIKTDKHLLETAQTENWHSGSTVVLSVIIDKEIWIANAGDSEAVLGKRSPNGCEPVLLSQKHKPSDNDEKERIKKAGGHVVFGRVMGSLAVARALGDKDFKFPYNKADADFVSAEPYITKLELLPDYEFLIISCDGLWDRLSYKQAVDFVDHSRKLGRTPTETAELLVKDSLDRGTLDNVTAIVIYLTPAATRKPTLVEGKKLEDDDSNIDVYEFLQMEAERLKHERESQSGISKKKLFDLPEDEKVLEEYPCGLGKMKNQGILFLTQNSICFYSKKNTVKVSIKDIQEISKVQRIILSQGINISTIEGKKFLFVWKKNSPARDNAFKQLLDLVKGESTSVIREEVEEPVDEQEQEKESSGEDDQVDGTNISNEIDRNSDKNWSRFDD